ncbi:MAG: Ig-like domain-containing protein, partial [Methanocellales archaeon]|nr:Ig-like domain-containing protein [Methanocellales archaeon]
DTTKPTFHSPGLSDTELLRYQGEKVELWINITDNINVSTSNFTIMYPDGASYNFTASWKNGTAYTEGFWNYTFDSTGQPLGTYNWTFAHANDTSDNWNSTSVNLEFVVKSPVLDVSIYEYQNVTRLSSYDFNASVTNSGNINATNAWLNWTLPANWTITAGDQDKFLGNLTPSQKEWNNITVKINLTADLGPKEIMANSTCDEVQGGDTKTIYVWASTSIPSVLIDNTNPVQGETVKIDARLIYDNTSAIADQNMTFYYENETGLYSIGSNFTNASGWATFNWNTSTVAYGTYNINATYAGNSSILWTLASHNNTQTVKVQPKAGPNCHYCHDVGTPSQRSEYKVNISLMNETLAIHKYLNKDATSTTQNESDKRCWACHGDDDGDEIANETEQPGDRHSVNYDVPKKCGDCHIEGNFSASVVKEHYPLGEDIKTNVSLGINESCISCHNKTEMKLDYSSDPSGPKSDYAAISHYGKNRSDLIVDSSTNCSYCHQNESTVFPFVYACNKTIEAHTPRTTINCINSTCHNAARIHATSLQVRRLGSENTTYCQNSGCHAGRETHNATVNCTTCHAYIPRDIHPIKYLLQNDTYGTSNATAVNCTTCHMSTVVDANLTPSSAPKIPTSTNFDFNHSEDEMAGHKWNKVYWDNTSDLSACMYCHNDTKHNVTAIGIHVSIIAYNDTRNTTISTTSYWCAGCHYQGDENYTEMVALFESKGMPVPPEITGNASYAPGTAADGTDYEDHSAYGFHDEACANCHGALLKLMTTVEFKHAVAIGVPGNPNCTTCHDLGGTSKYHVDVQAMNTTSYTHYDLNNQSAITTLPPGVDWRNTWCWACHGEDDNSDGNATFDEQPAQGHPTPYRENTRICTKCHYDLDAPQNFGAAKTYGHTWYSEKITLSALVRKEPRDYCTNCHAHNEMILPNEDPDYGTFDADEDGTYGGSRNADHYERLRTDLYERWNESSPSYDPAAYCCYCHQNSSVVFRYSPIGRPNFAKETNLSRSDHNPENHTNPGCGNDTCHGPYRLHTDELQNPTWFTTENCSECHAEGPVTPGAKCWNYHDGIINCTACHMEVVPRDIHPILYLQHDAKSYTQSKKTGIDCEDCHEHGYNPDASAWMQARGYTCIKVAKMHSNDPTNGSKWGDFWSFTPEAYVMVYSHVSDTKVTNFANMQKLDTSYATITEEQPPGIYPKSYDYPTNREFTDNASGWTHTETTANITQSWDPAGCINSSALSGKYAVGTGNWTANFTYNAAQAVGLATLSFDRKCTNFTSGDKLDFVIRIQKPSGTWVTIYPKTEITGVTDWVSVIDYTIPNSTFNEAGEYNLTITTSFNNSATGGLIQIKYDNVKIHIKEYLYRYHTEFKITNVVDYVNKTLGLEYMTSGDENATLSVKNASGVWNLKGTLYKGAFIYTEYALEDDEIIDGNVTIKIVDENTTKDAVSSFIRFRYLFVHSDTGKYRQCEYCHGTNKHYKDALGVPLGYNGTNIANQSIDKGNWCAGCHYQGYESYYPNGTLAANYSDTIATIIGTYGKPMPPEITGNATYGANTSHPHYQNHSEFTTSFNDSDCFECHGYALSSDVNMTNFTHHLSAAGFANCVVCHDIGQSFAMIDVSTMNQTGVSNRSIHYDLNDEVIPSDRWENRLCWACHGNDTDEDGVANESEQLPCNPWQHRNPRMCDNCHTTGNFSSPLVSEHYSNGTEIKTNTSLGINESCISCHNKTEMKLDYTSDPGGPKSDYAAISHYGLNRTSDLVSAGATNCSYCHQNESTVFPFVYA